MTSLASLEPYDRSDCESRHVYVCDGMMFNLSCDKQLELTNFTSFFCQQFYIPCDCKLISYVYTHTHVCTYRGCASNTRGTAFVVYEDIFDAKNACEHLSGFNVCNRYLVVLYYQPHKVYKWCTLIMCYLNWAYDEV